MKIISIGEKDIQMGNVISHENLKKRVSEILDNSWHKAKYHGKAKT
jgi:hypothetical protein